MGKGRDLDAALHLGKEKVDVEVAGVVEARKMGFVIEAVAEITGSRGNREIRRSDGEICTGKAGKSERGL